MHLPSLLFCCLLATAALAQTTNNLIGVTRGAPMVSERDHATCGQLATCGLAGLPPSPLPYAGGSAWDPMRQSVWISNGPSIGAHVPTTCIYYCVPQPWPLLASGALVTGLEVVESQDQLWILDSNGLLHQATLSCQPAIVGSCSTGLVPTATMATGGLAVDECNGLVFCSYSDHVTGGGNRLYVASLATPCQPFQQAPLAGCAGLGALTGLAADGCRNVLYGTDGVTTVAWPYSVQPGPSVVFGNATCCTLPSPGGAANTLIGLAVRTGRATSSGTACSNGACPACAMTHTLRNSPNLGNAMFGLDVSGAGFGTFLWCVVGHGPCAATGPVLPPLCGPALVAPTLLTLGPFLAPAGGGCFVYAPFHFPLPMAPGLCGVVLSSQFVALCPSGTTFGTALSNCLSWELQSN